MDIVKNTALLEVRDLSFSFHTYIGEVQAVRGVSFTLKRGKTLGLVGESGCGKSVTAKSVVRLNPLSPAGEYKNGQILLEGRNLAELSEKQMQRIRAMEIRMIFQDPMTCLNPTMKVGRQIMEGILKYGNVGKQEAKRRAMETLVLAGIPDPEVRFGQYPHEFSGGMRQRAMIALAMAVKPKILIADEPTTALDVTTQAQILDVLRQIQSQYGTAMLMITHDLGVVAGIADYIAVMYAGKIMEYGTVEDIFEYPMHPYTWGVLQSIPPAESDERKPLHPIPGSPPDLFQPPTGCPFAARCPYCMKVCGLYEPKQSDMQEHIVFCWLYHPKAKRVVNPVTGRRTQP